MGKWPSKKNLDKILPELEKREGTKHLGKDASPLDKFRWELCQKLVKYKLKNNLKQRELAELLGIDESQVSRVLRHRIDKISTDKLAEFVLTLEPTTNLKVS